MTIFYLGGGLNQPSAEMAQLTATQQLTQAIELRSQQQTSPSPNSVPAPTGAVAGAQLGVGQLTASQSQFLSSLAAQNEDAKTNNAFATSGTTNQYASATSATYGAPVNTSSYGSSQGYGSMQDQMNAQTQQTMQPTTRTKTQRARVPPPSKVSFSTIFLTLTIRYFFLHFLFLEKNFGKEILVPGRLALFEHLDKNRLMLK